MQAQTLEGHSGTSVQIDGCLACQSFWFDTHESIALTPGGTLALFRLIGEQATQRPGTHADIARCPRCRARLGVAHDMQRTTRFEYLKCPNGHGRLTTFFNFLREKDFIRPLTPQQITDLRQHLQTVNCANCGAPVDLASGAACTHCGSPLSMLDMRQAEALVAQLTHADNREKQGVDPTFPLAMARAKREAEQAFAGLERDPLWFDDASSVGLIGAGVNAIARWLKQQV
jgi:DNA-directed RNA polymerase subunit RPC12/RpoP